MWTHIVTLRTHMSNTCPEFLGEGFTSFTTHCILKLWVISNTGAVVPKCKQC